MVERKGSHHTTSYICIYSTSPSYCFREEQQDASCITPTTSCITPTRGWTYTNFVDSWSTTELFICDPWGKEKEKNLTWKPCLYNQRRVGLFLMLKLKGCVHLNSKKFGIDDNYWILLCSNCFVVLAVRILSWCYSPTVLFVVVFIDV